MSVQNNMLGISYMMYGHEINSQKSLSVIHYQRTRRKLIFHYIHKFNIDIPCNTQIEIFSNRIDRK